MFPTPTAVGLWACDQVIIDRDTKKPSLIGIFTGLAVDSFPADYRGFSFFSTLTGGSGTGTIRLEVGSDETSEVVYRLKSPVHFQDRLTIVNCAFRVRRARFSEAGMYSANLWIDSDVVAQTRFRVYRAASEKE